MCISSYELLTQSLRPLKYDEESRGIRMQVCRRHRPIFTTTTKFFLFMNDTIHHKTNSLGWEEKQ